MRYIVIVDDEELRGNGDELTLEEVKYEVGELLRSGYFNVQSIDPMVEDLCPDCDAPLREKSLQEGGGEVCSKNCGYWFCY